MSETTTHLALPYIMAAQAQKHVTHNESLTVLDTLVQLGVTSRSLTAPPVDPGEGDRFIVATGASGDWAEQDGNLVVYQDEVWVFYVPQTGWNAWVEDEKLSIIFDGSSWRIPETITSFGAFTRFHTTEEELSLSGPVVTANIHIPARVIVLGVSVLVTTTITGATSFDVGVSGESDKFGGGLGINLGDTNIGVIGPSATYTPTPIQLTANGGDFTSGTVRLVLHMIACGPALI